MQYIVLLAFFVQIIYNKNIFRRNLSCKTCFAVSDTAEKVFYYIKYCVVESTYKQKGVVQYEYYYYNRSSVWFRRS